MFLTNLIKLSIFFSSPPTSSSSSSESCRHNEATWLFSLLNPILDSFHLSSSFFFLKLIFSCPMVIVDKTSSRGSFFHIFLVGCGGITEFCCCYIPMPDHERIFWLLSFKFTFFFGFDNHNALRFSKKESMSLAGRKLESDGKFRKDFSENNVLWSSFLEGDSLKIWKKLFVSGCSSNGGLIRKRHFTAVVHWGYI